MAGRTIATSARWSAAGRGWTSARIVEEHGSGKGLLRVSTHLRPTGFGIVSAVAIAAALLASAIAGLGLRWPLAGAAAAFLAVAIPAFAAWRTAQVTAIVHRAVKSVADRAGMVAMKSGPARVPLVAPSVLRVYGLRTAAVFLVMIVGLGAGTFMLREVATAEVIGARKGYAGDNGPAIQAWLDTPGGITVAGTGDVYFADSNNQVIRRIDPRNNITTVVGNNALGRGFAGDFGPATEAQLDTPDGVAIAPDGDLIVADSHNDRIRRIDRQTAIDHDDCRLGGKRLRRRRQTGDRSAVEQPGRRRGGDQRRHLHRRHAELPGTDDRSRDRLHPHDCRRRQAGRRRRTGRRRRRGDRRPPQHAERRRDRPEWRHLYRRHASSAACGGWMPAPA